MIVTLAGGVGGSKFVKGLASSRYKEDVTVIINTGDDFERFGLYVSPDVDINIYTLAGLIHEQGWGFKDETYNTQNVLKDFYSQDCWFNLGDKDIATHIYRTHLLKGNYTLTEITKELCDRLGVSLKILPMSNDRIATYIHTPDGRFHFQEYLIQRRMSDKVLNIEYEGSTTASPSPGVLDTISEAGIILFAPSNPLVSIGPILSVPGMKEAIKNSKAKVYAISPIVNGGVIKGPADRMMRDMDMEVSPIGIAEFYGDLLDGIIIDLQDKKHLSALQEIGLEVLVTDTIMDSDEKKVGLANQVVEFAASHNAKAVL
ncbi:2-phospho-L-lactate transferase [Peribacillus glennii]|uniref:2-phospho-L-lactate transferase n=1 Tax=Peribacillus glennii TaxID=2303991 RepID=A0A372LFT2_9BACI|nr:2-phospho-L-lactate transferase [Peribacillus glennii]RFU65158.1 2-phospho-L-lactate transferase [Peribacillus glennii]